MDLIPASDYDALPLAIKMVYSEKEYAWLSTMEKNCLVQMETEPDRFDD